MTWVATGLFIAGVVLTTYNTIETQNRQDRQATAAVQNQARHQRRADAEVDKGVQELAASTAQDERRAARDSYLQALKANQSSAEVGLPAGGGSEAFQSGAKEASAQVQRYGADNAGLMATIEGANSQRLNEGFGYGRLATDLALTARNAEGTAHIDRLRQDSIRRNPWIDMAGSALQGAGGAMAGGGGGGKSGSLGQVTGGGGQQVGGNAAASTGYGGVSTRRYGMK
jgi:hypothetical protein